MSLHGESTGLVLDRGPLGGEYHSQGRPEWHGFNTIIALQSLSYINAGQSKHVCSIFQNETVVEISKIQKWEIEDKLIIYELWEVSSISFLSRPGTWICTHTYNYTHKNDTQLQQIKIDDH